MLGTCQEVPVTSKDYFLTLPPTLILFIASNNLQTVPHTRASRVTRRREIEGVHTT